MVNIRAIVNTRLSSVKGRFVLYHICIAVISLQINTIVNRLWAQVRLNEYVIRVYLFQDVYILCLLKRERVLKRDKVVVDDEISVWRKLQKLKN